MSSGRRVRSKNPTKKPNLEEVKINYIQKAESLFQLEQFEEALKFVEEGLTKESYNIKILMLKARLLDKMGDKEGALQICDLLLLFDPLNKPCHELKLRLLKRLRRFEYISKYLMKTMKLFPMSNGLGNFQLDH